MQKVMEKYANLSKFRKRIVDNITIAGYGFDVEKHIPVFVKFANGKSTDKRYIYYVSIEEAALSLIDESDLINEYVVVPVGYKEKVNFSVGIITHTIDTITEDNFDEDVVLEHIDKEFFIRPVLIAIGKKDEEGSPVGDYAAKIEKLEQKASLQALIEKEAKVAEENRRLAELAEHNPKLRSLLLEYENL